jgi:hypothetical protein
VACECAIKYVPNAVIVVLLFSVGAFAQKVNSICAIDFSKQMKRHGHKKEAEVRQAPYYKGIGSKKQGYVIKALSAIIKDLECFLKFRQMPFVIQTCCNQF